ncbi:hypothetical protein D3C76_1237750 [compost metagenome]
MAWITRSTSGCSSWAAWGCPQCCSKSPSSAHRVATSQWCSRRPPLRQSCNTVNGLIAQLSANLRHRRVRMSGVHWWGIALSCKSSSQWGGAGSPGSPSQLKPCPANTTVQSAWQNAPSVLEATMQRAWGAAAATASWLPRPFCSRISSASAARRGANRATACSAS